MLVTTLSQDTLVQDTRASLLLADLVTAADLATTDNNSRDPAANTEADLLAMAKDNNNNLAPLTAAADMDATE